MILLRKSGIFSIFSIPIEQKYGLVRDLSASILDLAALYMYAGADPYSKCDINWFVNYVTALNALK